MKVNESQRQSSSTVAEAGSDPSSNLIHEQVSESSPPADLINGSWPWCLWVNRDRDYWQTYPFTLARKHFTARHVQIDTGDDSYIDGRVLSVEADPGERTFSLRVILAAKRGRVVTLPYDFVMAECVWTMDRGGECGCDGE